MRPEISQFDIKVLINLYVIRNETKKNFIWKLHYIVSPQKRHLVAHNRKNKFPPSAPDIVKVLIGVDGVMCAHFCVAVEQLTNSTARQTGGHFYEL